MFVINLSIKKIVVLSILKSVKNKNIKISNNCKKSLRKGLKFGLVSEKKPRIKKDIKQNINITSKFELKIFLNNIKENTIYTPPDNGIL